MEVFSALRNKDPSILNTKSNLFDDFKEKSDAKSSKNKNGEERMTLKDQIRKEV